MLTKLKKSKRKKTKDDEICKSSAAKRHFFFFIATRVNLATHHGKKELMSQARPERMQASIPLNGRRRLVALAAPTLGSSTSLLARLSFNTKNLVLLIDFTRVA